MYASAASSAGAGAIHQRRHKNETASARLLRDRVSLHRAIVTLLDMAAPTGITRLPDYTSSAGIATDPGVADRISWLDHERRDLAALELEGEPQYDRTAREIAGQQARHDVTPILLLRGDGLAGV